jgi:hypothetical protein
LARAAVAISAVRNRIWLRDMVELMGDLFDARTMRAQILTRTADAQEMPHQDLASTLRRSARLNLVGGC